MCNSYWRINQHSHIGIPIGPKNTNLIDDIAVWLLLKFHWILFSCFRGKVENVNQKPASLTFHLRDILLPIKFFLNPVQWFLSKSRKCISQSEAVRPSWRSDCPRLGLGVVNLRQLLSHFCLKCLDMHVLSWNGVYDSLLINFRSSYCHFSGSSLKELCPFWKYHSFTHFTCACFEIELKFFLNFILFSDICQIFRNALCWDLSDLCINKVYTCPSDLPQYSSFLPEKE